MNWQTLSTDSPYRTAVAIKQEIEEGRIAEATLGLQELIEALFRSEKRALKRQLVRLMLHIIKWRAQPERRSLSWIARIEDARDEIADIREETPSLNEKVLQDLLARAFIIAKRDAEAEMGKRTQIETLTWAEVFDTTYSLGR
ncbi:MULTISPECIES: DUF29 family protein [unclassified Thiocapsa]|uniref:DUF29 family protein n=1 Tax=unclassified Thiocapsa TaxID=2641286 RepID=UPI0035B063D9